MTNLKWDAIWFNGVVTAKNEKNDAIAVKDSKIAWVGKLQSLNKSPHEVAVTTHDLKGKCLTAGFIDCHTHIIYGGNRANEFEKRLEGATYEEIARAGGGIQSTVNATRLASEEELYLSAKKRILTLMKSGVTTMEIKSGYGLNLESELKMLRVARKLSHDLPLTIKTTFLGAHTTPKEYQNKSDDYINYVCNEMLPRVAEEKLADFVDVFCEKIAFNLSQTQRVFETAKKYKLGIKCHAEQLSSSGAAKLAAEYGALSVDHLEYLDEESVGALKQSGSVAVLLPGAYYFLKEKTKPPVDLLRAAGVPIAIATDSNPGTSPFLSMTLMMHMACTLFGLTKNEALLAVTEHAAKALGLSLTHGRLAEGYVADFAIWDFSDSVELVYYAGYSPLTQLVKAGEIVV